MCICDMCVRDVCMCVCLCCVRVLCVCVYVYVCGVSYFKLVRLHSCKVLGSKVMCILISFNRHTDSSLTAIKETLLSSDWVEKGQNKVSGTRENLWSLSGESVTYGAGKKQLEHSAVHCTQVFHSPFHLSSPFFSAFLMPSSLATHHCDSGFSLRTIQFELPVSSPLVYPKLQ